ncbi:glycoside hydrolase family 5 protein [Zasmidium cellare ATCC 36951]|uniref:Glycoside hydrolase family 5 protein n=1 Tax=Zasmidium cellare ATCC 36951 TaxID=1080233 RepID=A0A6A6CBX7_ZASCE|nr:glycoside hydrolase family 5 protein [Zasmidium cellare ATCC 36951]KAF2164293.1 glycoside hydrolase family 5 protein [Zasmidium cellare ATCC 36951]
MGFPTFVCLLLALLTSFLPATASFPGTPFRTEGRWIVDTSGQNVTYTGVNWPGAADTGLPEGLQYSSVQEIVSKVKDAGFNIIRLTFAVQVIDEIYERHGEDVPISTAFSQALGAENGSAILNKVLSNNPAMSESTTRLEVFDAVAEECNRQGIYVHLDNHISKAEWCCSFVDGNTWFGDEYFSVANWTRALTYMTRHASNWPSFVSIGLRNELRFPLNNAPVLATYNWAVWYDNMIAAADAVYKTNPEILIFFSGLNSDLSLNPIPTGDDLGFGRRFDKNRYADKAVLELHKYDNNDISCALLKAFEYSSGYDALDDSNVFVKNHMPVVHTEFGYAQTNGSDDGGAQTVYARCIREFLIEQKAGWMVWVLAGSYYIRQGTQDNDESYGILSHDWSGYRNETVFDLGVGGMIRAARRWG